MPDGVATWSTTFCVLDLLLERIRTDIDAIKAEIGLLDIPPDAMPDVGTLKTDVATLQGNVRTLQSDVTTVRSNITTLQTNVGTLQTNVSTLQTNVSTAQGNITSLLSRMTTAEGSVSSLQTRMTSAENNITALQTNPEPITFVFGGVPAVNSMINVPLTRNLSITAANLSTNSRYYNNINPSSGTTTFQLRRMPAGTLIGAFNVNTSGGISWTNTTGSTTLAAGDTLRMTAAAVGPDVTDVAITIHATRRA